MPNLTPHITTSLIHTLYHGLIALRRWLRAASLLRWQAKGYRLANFYFKNSMGNLTSLLEETQ